MAVGTEKQQRAPGGTSERQLHSRCRDCVNFGDRLARRAYRRVVFLPVLAARASVAPPETVSQVRRRSTEPHGPNLRPSAGHGRLVRQGAGGHREPNGASTPVGRVLRHRARAPGGLRQPDRCERRATASHDAGVQGVS